jgi:porin
LFLAGTVGPDNPQFAQWNVIGSLQAFGMVDSRPLDSVGIASWYRGLSHNFKDLVSPVIDQEDTWGVEAYYNFAVSPWAHLSADIQIVQNGRTTDDLAIIPGVRLAVDF